MMHVKLKGSLMFLSDTLPVRDQGRSSQFYQFFMGTPIPRVDAGVGDPKQVRV